MNEYKRGRKEAIEDLKQKIGKILDENENIKGDMVLVELISLLRNFK